MSGTKLQTLGRSQASWIVRFSTGEVMPGHTQVNPEDDQDEDDEDLVGDPDDPRTKALAKLRLLRDKEEKKEIALKEKLINDALLEIAKMESSLSSASQLQYKKTGKDTWEGLSPESGDQSGKDAFELGNTKGVEKVKLGDKELDLKDSKEDIKAYHEAQMAFAKLQDLVKKNLAGQKTKRWQLPEKPPFEPIQVEEKLFTDEEIADEIYTPLVRDKTIGDTIVPPQYSRTRKVLDGSDDYYIKECKEKGKPSDSGFAALAKSGIALGTAIATTVVSGITQPSSTSGQDPNAISVLTKDQAARINAITDGIACGLTGFVDVIDKADTWKKGGEITAEDITGCMASITTGILKSVAGFAYDTSGSNDSASEQKAFEVALTGASQSVANVGVAWAKWFKDGRHGSPPWDYTVANFGSALGNAFGAVSDKVQVNDPNQSDQQNSDATTALDDKWSAASTAVNAAFPIFANAIKNKVFQKLAKGDKTAALNLLAEAGARAGQASFEGLQTNNMANSSSSDSSYDKVGKFQSDLSTATEQTIDGLQQGVDLLKEKSPKFDGALNNQKLEARKEQLKNSLRNSKKKKEKEDDDLKTPEDYKKAAEEIEKTLKQEDEEFRGALVSLGKDKPATEQEYKTIANMIAQYQKDEAIFKGVTAIFGAGIGAAGAVVEAFTTIAAEVAPPLKAAGQLIKYVTNLRAAMQRLEALDKWRETMEEAANAISPYQSSIKRFISSQTAQRNHYFIQAGANAINALLSVAQMSPLAPAFSAASGAVTATAALEDMIYKYKKQRELQKAWKRTKEAIDPANKDDRKMRLLARKLNPTLAKYTIAYGAVVEEDPVAIAAIDRIGLDRETLINSAGSVKDVKKFLETIYGDDGSVYVTLDTAGPPGFKAPKPELKPKTWALTFQAFVDKGMVGKNPPLITGNLALLTDLEPKVQKLQEEMEPLEEDDPKLAELRTATRALQDKQFKAFQALENAFRGFTPLDGDKQPMTPVKDAALVYADLAGAEAARVETEMEPAEGEGINIRKAGIYKLPNGKGKDDTI